MASTGTRATRDIEVPRGFSVRVGLSVQSTTEANVGQRSWLQQFTIYFASYRSLAHTAPSALASRSDAGKVHCQEELGGGLSGAYSILSSSFSSPEQPVILELSGTPNRLSIGISRARCCSDAHRSRAPRHSSKVSKCFNKASPLKYPPWRLHLVRLP